MTKEQEIRMHDFEALIRRLMQAYRAERDRRIALEAELGKVRRTINSTEEALQQQKHAYEVLKMARMIEISGDDMQASRARITKLIREVDKCIALLNV